MSGPTFICESCRKFKFAKETVVITFPNAQAFRVCVDCARIVKGHDREKELA